MSLNFRKSQFISAVVVLGSTILLSAQEITPPEGDLVRQNPVGEFGRQNRFPAQHREKAVANANLRLREGLVITDRGGFFRHDGDGAVFITEDGYELTALPNLNLERIIRTLKSADEAQSIRWSVSGKVTEFSGRNYLLISRAVYKSSVPPPAPEHL